jgi:hypothetical protein
MTRFRVFLLSLVALAVGAEGLTVATPAIADASKPFAKIHPILLDIRDEATTNESIDEGQRGKEALVVSNERVLVSALAAGGFSGWDLRADLKDLGLKGGSALGGAVSGMMPVSSLSQAKGLKSLKYMRPEWVTTNAGLVNSQGDAAQRSDIARATHLVTGAGVQVGTLSDSYNCLGGAAVGQVTGDLPATVTNLDEGPCPASDEGRGMMEIIHDVAPGSTQLFHNAFEGIPHFAQGIVDLADNGADVINDDITYIAESWFQDSPITQAVNTVAARGISYFSSAGNSADNSYEAGFRNSGVPGKVGGSTRRHDFDPSATVDTRQTLTIGGSSTIRLGMQWIDPNGEFSTDPAVRPASDLDLHAYVLGTNSLIASSEAANPLTESPFEFLALTNNGAAPASFDLQIDLFSGPAPSLVKWIAVRGLSGTAEHDTFSSTVIGHHNAATGMATSAASSLSTPASPESFTSLGGTEIFFDNDGKRLTRTVRKNGRKKKIPTFQSRSAPRFTAPDGGNTTFFGSDIGSDVDGTPNFFGTSAAAPHAAGAAALGLQKVPTASWYDICNAFSATATDLSTAGFDLLTGSGHLDVDSALSVLAPGSYGACRAKPKKKRRR